MDTELFQRQLRILHLEDNEYDHLLVAETLVSDGLKCEFVIAKSKPEFVAALGQEKFDLIISDYSLPSYDGMSALLAAQEQSAETPFVFFSGTIGEDLAVESLCLGAVDYVLKQRPGRLVAAVRRALRNAEERARLKRTEGALLQSEERLHIVAKATNDVVWEWNLANDQIWFGENFSTAFGHALEPAIPSERWFEFMHPDDRDRVVSSLCALLAAGGRVWWGEHRLRRGDGTYAHIYDRASVIYDEAGKPMRLVGIKVDMSERREAEGKIREQAALLDKAHDAIIICDFDHKITFWNQGAERIYGWSAAEVIGQDVHKLFFQSELPPTIAEMTKSLAERGEWMGELQEFTKDGKKLIVRARSTIIRGDSGQPKSLLTINTDITEHKQLEEQFLRAQRLESLGSLVSGIAHDLNNTLVPILIGVEILQCEPLSETAVGMLHTMETSARRSAEMIRQMLAFARGTEAGKQLLQPDRLLEEMGRIMRDTFPKAIECRVQLGEDLQPIHCVATQIHQVLMNLCVNARDAMPGQGKLTLLAENITLDIAASALLTGARPGRYVCIRVADSGTGITPEQMGKLFQPFFTTKAPGKGTGLGLTTCQSIIKKHEGFISVKSQLKSGTEFSVYLPVAASNAVVISTRPPVAPPSGKGEHILVVDDEESILAMIRAALENYGYVVSTALSGIEAVTRFRGNPDALKLVISDHDLPFMGGEGVPVALRKIRPDVKIILMSSSARDGVAALTGAKTNGFIAKPFTPEQLLKITHDVLLQTDSLGTGAQRGRRIPVEV